MQANCMGKCNENSCFARSRRKCTFWSSLGARWRSECACSSVEHSCKLNCIVFIDLQVLFTPIGDGQFDVIIRVMDYDWGKKDDILGKFVSVSDVWFIVVWLFCQPCVQALCHFTSSLTYIVSLFLSGEIHVDIRNFLDRGEMEVPLTRKGKPEKGVVRLSMRWEQSHDQMQQVCEVVWWMLCVALRCAVRCVWFSLCDCVDSGYFPKLWAIR